MNDARIGSAAIVSDSVVGASSILGDQMMVESGPCVVEVEEAFLRAEFGAIISDNVTAGARVMAHAGTVVGSGARIDSGSIVRGQIERESRVMG